MARLLLCQKAATHNHRCKPLLRAPQFCGVSVVGNFFRRSRSISIPRTKAMEKSSQTEEQSQSHSHDSSTSSHDHQNWKTLRISNSTFPNFIIFIFIHNQSIFHFQRAKYSQGKIDQRG
jgi:hypothetical protein